MSNIFAISDLHLSGYPTPFKPMEKFGCQYDNYMTRIETALQALPKDSILIHCGDFSWGNNRLKALPDFQWLNSFGFKVVYTRGNHDWFWGDKPATFMSNWALDNGLDNSYFVDHRQLFTLGKNGPTLAAVHGVERREQYELDLDNSGQQKSTWVNGYHWQKYRQQLIDALELKPDILACHIPPFDYAGQANELTDIVNASSVKMILYGHRHKAQPTQYERDFIEGKFWINLLAERNEFKPISIGIIDTNSTYFSFEITSCDFTHITTTFC